MFTKRYNMHSKPLLPRGSDSRPEHWAPNLHSLLVERTHRRLDIALVYLRHELAHGLLGLWRGWVRRDGAC